MFHTMNCSYRARLDKGSSAKIEILQDPKQIQCPTRPLEKGSSMRRSARSARQKATVVSSTKLRWYFDTVVLRYRTRWRSSHSMRRTPGWKLTMPGGIVCQDLSLKDATLKVIRDVVTHCEQVASSDKCQWVSARHSEHSNLNQLKNEVVVSREDG